MHNPLMQRQASSSAIFLVIAASTALGIAGVDLILPSIPHLPVVLGGTITTAQYVLASYSVGTAIGLVAFGELSGRFDRTMLFAASLALFSLVSAAASMVPTIEWLVVLRFFQGGLGAAPAVFAPGLIRSIYGDDDAPKALGWLGSIESLAPALAPVLGLFLFQIGGWRSAYIVMAVIGAASALAARQMLQASHVAEHHAVGSYLQLLRKPLFLRYALSQALSLGSILIFVFGAPVVFTKTMGLAMTAFIIMQLIGVFCFICGSVISTRLASSIGVETTIFAGTALLAASFAAIFILALAGTASLEAIVALFAVNGFGFGMRGPLGFHRAIVSADGDDARAAAMVVLMFLLTAAIGTGLVAPFLVDGLVPLAGLASLISSAALAVFVAGRPALA